jgi:hypothetical protein
MNGQMVMINCLSGEGDVGKYCFRLGDTPMTSGIVKMLRDSSYIPSFERLVYIINFLGINNRVNSGNDKS